MLTSQSHWSLFNGTWQKRPRRVSFSRQKRPRRVSFSRILASQSNWSLFNGTWQKRPRRVSFSRILASQSNWSHVPLKRDHGECHSVVCSHLNVIGLFSTERGKRDLENLFTDCSLSKKKWLYKCKQLYWMKRRNWMKWRNSCLFLQKRILTRNWSRSIRSMPSKPTGISQKSAFCYLV